MSAVAIFDNTFYRYPTVLLRVVFASSYFLSQESTSCLAQSVNNNQLFVFTFKTTYKQQLMGEGVS